LTFNPVLKQQFQDFYPTGNIDELHDHLLADKWTTLTKRKKKEPRLPIMM